MTTYNQTTLKTFFETGDVPQGSDYANLIDSCLNVVNTGVQTLAGAIQPTELATARVSAGNVNITGTLTIAGSTTFGTAISSPTVSANAVVTNTVSATTTYSNTVQTQGIYIPVTTVSAAGSTQATGASLGSTGIIYAKGIVDGATTGFTLNANLTGLQQTLYVAENTSCNLWPCVGGQINALSSNATFAMAGNTTYIITHIKASGYAVK